MDELLTGWVMTLTGTAMLAACGCAISRASAAGKVVELVCSLGMLAALLSCVNTIDLEAYGRYLAEARSAAQQLAADAQEEGKTQTRIRIEEQCGAYISDKAAQMGLEVEAEVTCRWQEEGYWLPVRAEIFATVSESAREKLSDYMTAELGIPPEAQHWEAQRDGETP